MGLSRMCGVHGIGEQSANRQTGGRRCSEESWEVLAEAPHGPPTDGLRVRYSALLRKNSRSIAESRQLAAVVRQSTKPVESQNNVSFAVGSVEQRRMKGGRMCRRAESVGTGGRGKLLRDQSNEKQRSGGGRGGYWSEGAFTEMTAVLLLPRDGGKQTVSINDGGAVTTGEGPETEEGGGAGAGRRRDTDGKRAGRANKWALRDGRRPKPDRAGPRGRPKPPSAATARANARQQKTKKLTNGRRPTDRATADDTTMTAE